VNAFLGVHHPVNRNDRHLLALPMATDSLVAWQCLSKRTIGSLLWIKLHSLLITEFYQVVTQEHPLETELDFEEEFIPDDDDISTDSDVAIVASPIDTDAIDSSYLVNLYILIYYIFYYILMLPPYIYPGGIRSHDP
jgi:hypothetical protein